MAPSRNSFATLLLLGLLGSASSFECGGKESAAAHSRQEAVPAAKDELQCLRAASRLLAQRGYPAEGTRLQEILTQLEEMKAAPKMAPIQIEAGAKGLLQLDVQDRGARAKMLDLIAEGLRATGDGESVEALRFFANVTRVNEAQVDELKMPRSLVAGEATLLTRLVLVIRSAGEALPGFDCPRAAEVADRLDRFYVARESARSAPSAEEMLVAKLKTLGYLDGKGRSSEGDDLVDMLVQVQSLQGNLARLRDSVIETTREMNRAEVRLLLRRDRR